jgi:hypothetical protein
LTTSQAFAQQPETQAPAPQPPQQQTPAADTTQQDQARSHLAEARRVLSEVTTMPQAAQLQGEARTQVSQLITNFNALITAQSNWREKYASVEQNLNTLLGAGADTAVTGTTGTTTTTTGTAGTTGSTATTTTSKAVTVDPAIKTKLEEFKRHLTAFHAAAGGPPPASSEPASPTSSSTTSTTTTTTTTPTPEPPSTPAQPPATTPSTTPATPPSTTAPATEPSADEDDVARQIDAIEKSLSEASCDPAKMAAIRAQLTELRQAVKNPQ